MLVSAVEADLRWLQKPSASVKILSNENLFTEVHVFCNVLSENLIKKKYS